MGSSSNQSKIFDLTKISIFLVFSLLFPSLSQSSICRRLARPSGESHVYDANYFLRTARAATPPLLLGMGNLFRTRPLAAHSEELKPLLLSQRIPEAHIQLLKNFLHTQDLVKNPKVSADAAEAAALKNPPRFGRMGAYEEKAFQQLLHVRDNLMDALKILMTYDRIHSTFYAYDGALSALNELEVFDLEWIELLETVILHPTSDPEHAAEIAVDYLTVLNHLPDWVFEPMVNRAQPKNFILETLPRLLDNIAAGPVDLLPHPTLIDDIEIRLLEIASARGTRFQKKIQVPFSKFRLQAYPSASIGLSTTPATDQIIEAYLENHQRRRAEMRESLLAMYQKNGLQFPHAINDMMLDHLVVTARHSKEPPLVIAELFVKLSLQAQTRGLTLEETVILMNLVIEMDHHQQSPVEIGTVLESYLKFKGAVKSLNLEECLNDRLIFMLISLSNRKNIPLLEVLSAFSQVHGQIPTHLLSTFGHSHLLIRFVERRLTVVRR